MSTNVLALMQLVPAGSNPSAQMETLFEEGQSRALGTLPGLFRANEQFNLFGKEPADRCRAAGGQNSGFSHGFRTDADRNVLLRYTPENDSDEILTQVLMSTGWTETIVLGQMSASVANC